MNTSKHTSGPWRVGVNQHGGAHVVGDDQLVCQLPGGGNCGLELNDAGKAHSLADAHLIAAAPELVEALRKIHMSQGQSEYALYVKGIARAALAQVQA